MDIKKLEKGLSFLMGRLAHHKPREGFFYRPEKGLFKKGFSSLETKFVVEKTKKICRKKSSDLIENIVLELKEMEGTTLREDDIHNWMLWIKLKFKKELNFVCYSKYGVVETGLFTETLEEALSKAFYILNIFVSKKTPKMGSIIKREE